MAGGGSTGGQTAYVSGPSIEAAQMAANAQTNAAQMAASTATQNTQSAIQALMSQYNTSMNLSQPITSAGNAAAAQLNYILGGNAMSPGAAPTAPTAPTLSSLSSQITPDQISQYLLNHSTINGNTAGAGQQQNYVYSGTGSAPGTALGANGLIASPAGGSAGGMGTAWSGSPDQVATNAAFADPIKAALAQQGMTAANQQYQTQLGEYNNNLQAYNQANTLYNQYNQKGPATGSDVTNIIQNQPGYFQQQQAGISAAQNAASANGMLNSGNLLIGLNQFGGNLAQNYYQNYVGNLQNLAGLGASTTNNLVNSGTNTGNSVAGAQTALGDTVANAQLAAGAAQASSYLTPAANQQFNTKSMGGSNSGSGLGQLAGDFAGGVLSGYLSTKELKDTISTPSTKDILDNLDRMTLDKWKYKGIDEEHIGPYAEEFKELFGVGTGKSISLVDALGVLFGAVKQLSKEVKDLRNN